MKKLFIAVIVGIIIGFLLLGKSVINNRIQSKIPNIPGISMTEVSVTPAKDTGKTCSDGNECSTGWCVDYKCYSKEVNPHLIGDYVPVNFIVNGKTFPVSGYGDKLVIQGDENDPDLQTLKSKLCKYIKCEISK